MGFRGLQVTILAKNTHKCPKKSTEPLRIESQQKRGIDALGLIDLMERNDAKNWIVAANWLRNEVHRIGVFSFKSWMPIFHLHQISQTDSTALTLRFQGWHGGQICVS